MSLGRSFEEAMQKAIRMLNIGEPGIVGGSIYESNMSMEDALNSLRARKPYWLLYAAKAFREGASVRDVANACGVSEFFLFKIKELVDFYEDLKKRGGVDEKKLIEAKRLGFSDAQIAKATGIEEDDVRRIRRKLGIMPSIKQIDTMAGEQPASTNYLYLTYNGDEDDVKPRGGGLLILGGPASSE